LTLIINKSNLAGSSQIKSIQKVHTPTLIQQKLVQILPTQHPIYMFYTYAPPKDYVDTNISGKKL